MRRGSRERGMSLVVAIFLITVVASLAAFAVNVGSATRESENLQLQADRAMAAASAGVEWGAFRALVLASCPGLGSPTVVPLNEVALRGFRVTVTCTTLSSGPSTVFEIVSFAQWGNFGAANYASRRVVRRVW
jgi:MSHA biogenesis protein MshP